jgi:hypothetical protein
MEKHRDHSGTDLDDSATPGTSDAARPPGRPRHNADELKRTPLSIRTTAPLKRALEEAAKGSGKSLAQEIEYRLWRSLDDGEQGQFVTDEDSPVSRLDEAVEDIDWRLDELRDLLREVRKIYSITGVVTRPIYLGNMSVKIDDDGRALLFTRRDGRVVDVTPVDLEPKEETLAGAPELATMAKEHGRSFIEKFLPSTEDLHDRLDHLEAELGGLRTALEADHPAPVIAGLHARLDRIREAVEALLHPLAPTSGGGEPGEVGRLPVEIEVARGEDGNVVLVSRRGGLVIQETQTPLDIAAALQLVGEVEVELEVSESGEPKRKSGRSA